MTPHPISDTYLDVQTARVFAILPAAGAWDAAPTEMACPGFDYVTLYVSYIEGAVPGGAVDFRIEISPDSTGAVWHRLSVQALGALAPGADVESDIQAGDFSFNPTTVNREYFSYGPIQLGGTVERIRVAAQETGQVATPGSCEIELRFG